MVTAFNSSSVSGIIFFLGNLLMLKRGGYCSLFAALFTKLNLRRSPSSLRASACCLSLINVGSRVGVPIVQGEVKGLKEFDQLITEESKLKKSHSAISFILKLCKVSSLFIFSSFSIGSSVMRWALLGGLCSTGGSRGGGLGGCVLVGWGVGARGWRRHPPPQTPATPPSPCETCPPTAHQQIHHLLWQFVINRSVPLTPPRQPPVIVATGTFEVWQRAQVQNCTSRLHFGGNTFQLLNTNIKLAYLRLTLKQVGTCSDASFGGPPEKYQTEFSAVTI